MPKVRVCARSDVKDGELKRFTVGEMDVLVASVAGRLHALEDRCGHMSAPFSLGKLEGPALTCPMHQGQFDIVSGKMLRAPNIPIPVDNPRARLFTLIRTYPLRKFPVEERGGDVYVEVP